MMSKEEFSRIVSSGRVRGTLMLAAYYFHVATLVCVLLLCNVVYSRLGFLAHKRKCVKI